MISSIQFIPKGSSARNPRKFELTNEEYDLYKQATIMGEDNTIMGEENDMGEDDTIMGEDDTISKDNTIMGEDNKMEMDKHGLPVSMNMEDYDDEDEGAAFHEDFDEMELEPEMEDEEDEDRDDMEIKRTDGVILVANTEEDFSSLEIQIYDEEEGNLYVHHEIALPAFPLSLAWMDISPLDVEKSGSFVAIGTFKTGIEIWDLDILDALEPVAVLGGEDCDDVRDVATCNRMRTDVPLKEESHQDAVMCLSWNRQHRNMLLSGSADHSVKLWDVTTQKCMYTFKHHSDKVQCVSWNPLESSILASAGFDKKLVIVDAKKPQAVNVFTLPCDPEALVWNPNMPNVLVVALESGVVQCYDVRKSDASALLLSFQAHEKTVSGISFSWNVPGLFATASVDKSIKLWDFTDMNTRPDVVASKEMAVGDLYNVEFYQDAPFLLATAGSSGVLALWDVSENANVERRFLSRCSATPNHVELPNIGDCLKTPEELLLELEATNPTASVTKKTKKSKKKNKK